jgi:hypothetical protein
MDCSTSRTISSFPEAEYHISRGRHFKWGCRLVASLGKAKPGGGKPGDKGHSRALSEDADRIIDQPRDQCLCCRASLSNDLPAETVSEHDKIELPANQAFD